ncbi:MAG: VWA domain-containing protein [Candidatus Dadabacteria bacterium]|nr:MAG: VWA domain-containing protein [Candidatus Dadabacteria bacterium]
MQYRSFRALNKSKVYGDEHGVFLVIAAAALIAIIGLIGLAVDCANLFLTKRQLQTVVDASALAGGRVLVFQIDTTTDQVRARMVKLIRENLALMNYSQQEIDKLAPDPKNSLPPTCNSDAALTSPLCIDISDNRQQVNIALRRTPSLHFLNVIPGIDKFTQVSAAAKAVNTKLEVVLVLDMSWSMNRSIPNPPPGCSDRLCAAKYAANKFLDMMLPFDEATIVTFASNYSKDVSPAVKTVPADYTALTAEERLANYANDARVEYPCPDYSSSISPPQPATCSSSPFVMMGDKNSATRQNFKNLINALDLYGNTNIGAGLYKARNLFVGDPPPNTQRTIILFTDGSPATEPGAYSGPLSSADMAHKAILQNPYDSVDTDMYFLQCGDRTLEENKLQLRQLGVPALASIEKRYVEYDKDTLFGYNADQVPSKGPNNNNYELQRRLRFMDAILEAQAAQRRGIIVYTVGLGPIDPNVYPSRVDDPYPASRIFYSPFQDGRQKNNAAIGSQYAEQVKEAFMALLANDQTRLKNPTVLPNPMPAGYSASYFWKFPCVPNGPEMVGKPEGLFVNVSDGNGLVNAFELIAHDLRTRLES